jgi:hypothetical protein
MMLGTSIAAPEIEYSKALNIQYPKAIDGDAIGTIDPTYGAQTWVKYGGQWSIDPVDDRYPVKRIIADYTSTPVPTRIYHYSTGSFDQEVIADSAGRIVAGDPGQMTISQWLSANSGAFVFPPVPTVGKMVTTATGVDSGKLALVGLLGLLLLRGAFK